MAQITWMNVPIPQIDSTQGIRTAADLLGNATRSATAGVAGLQAIQDAQEAAKQQAADRFVLEKMLSTQDPNTYNQMRADGSILGPAADRVSSNMLQAVEARSNTLYNLDRERTRNAELQAAEKLWDQAAPVAVDNPAKAQEILAGAKFSNTEDAAAFALKARQLYVDPENARAATERKKKEERDRASADLANRYIQMGADPEGRAALLQGEKDPLVLQGALSFLRANGEDTKTSYSTTPATSDTPTAGIIDGVQNAQYRQFGNNLNIGLKAVKEAGVNAPFPGSPDWVTQNGGRTPTAADVMNWTDTYVKPGSEAERGKGKGTTAIGPYQIVNSTRRDFIERYGKQLFGTTDPTKIPFTLENEDKLAGKIYEEQLVKNKSKEAWTSTQNYPSLADLKAFEGKSWDQAKPLLTYIDGGVAPASFTPQIRQIEASLESRRKNLSEGAKVILNAEPNESWGLNQAAENLVKSFGKDTRPGEARELVEKTVRKAKEAGTTITHAEAVELIKNAISDDGNVLSLGIFAGRVPTVSDLNDDLDLKESKLIQTAKDLGNAREDLKSFKKNEEALKKVQELAEQYKKDKVAAEGQLAKARSPNSNAGVATINAFRKWQNTSDQLAKLVAGNPKTEVNNTLVQEATPTPASTVPRVAMPPNMDLMLPPEKPSTPLPQFGSNQFNSR